MFGIYIHWPFCLNICHYCDFTRYIKDDTNEDKLIELYIKQIDYFHTQIDNKKEVTSIYFGGGTPSLMKPLSITSLIDHIYKKFNISKNCEITLESNPTSFEISKFQDYKIAGVNRLSIGIQSFQDKELLFLGRKHTAKEAINAIEKSKNIFSKVTFDLIYGLPLQDLTTWNKNLDIAMQFDTNHLSLYMLTVEENTGLETMVKNKTVIMPSDGSKYKFYTFTNNYLKSKSFEQYEISNYSRNKEYSQHNLIYWKHYDYMGIGVGAHGRLKYLNGKRYAIECSNKVRDFFHSDQNGIKDISEIKNIDQVNEIILSGLRINKGIDLNDIKDRFDIDLIDNLDKNKLSYLLSNNFLNLNSSKTKLKTTKKGQNVLNNIIKDLFL